jgi:putative ABC transport system permease protein
MLRRWRKTLGATLGVGIALAIVVALLGVAAGGTYVYTGEYLESDADLYLVTHRGAIVVLLSGDSPGIISNASALLSQIHAMPGVSEVVGFSFGSVGRDLERSAEGKRRSEQWFAIGVQGNPSAVPGMLDLRQGRWLRRSNEIVLSQRLAETKQVALDDEVTVQDRRFRVVGIGHVNGVGFAGLGSAYFDRTALRDMLEEGDQVSIVAVAATDPAETAGRIRDVRNVDVYTRDDVEAKLLDLLNTATVFYYLFSLLALAIAALFVANVLTISVSSRRVEFATLRAIGVPRRLIFLLVIGEALVIALLAYALGAVLGWVVGQFLNTLYAPLVKVDQFVVFEPVIFLRVFAIALTLSVLSAVLPARAALRIQPVEALREA